MRDEGKFNVYWVHGIRYSEDFPVWDISLPRGGYVLTTPSGKCFIVDCAVGSGLHLYKDFLDWLGVEKVDAIFITHFHWDHFNAIGKLIETGIEIDTIYSNGVYSKRYEDVWQQNEMLDTIQDYGINYVYGTKDDVIYDPDVSISLLSPDVGDARPPNEAPTYYDGHRRSSIIPIFSYKGFSIMFNNDMMAKELEYVCQNQNTYPQVTVMQLPHHGDPAPRSLNQSLIDVINASGAELILCESYLDMDDTLNFLRKRNISYNDGRESGRFHIEVSSNGEYQIKDIPQKIIKSRGIFI